MEMLWLTVEGKRLFHPQLVHFPIALFVLEAFLVFLWMLRSDERYERFAFFVLKIAIFMMPWVMLAGFLDSGGLSPRTQPHFSLALGLFILNSTRLIIRWKAGPLLWQSRWRRIYPVLILVGVLLTVFTGHFGAKLVYF